MTITTGSALVEMQQQTGFAQRFRLWLFNWLACGRLTVK